MLSLHFNMSNAACSVCVQLMQILENISCSPLPITLQIEDVKSYSGSKFKKPKT